MQLKAVRERYRPEFPRPSAWLPEGSAFSHLKRLIVNHQFYHRGEERIMPDWNGHGQPRAYHLYGQPAPLTQELHRLALLYLENALNLQKSSVAALLLHQKFGAGNIAWNRQADQIEIKTTIGGQARLITLQGTNLNDAAAYLLRVHDSLERRLFYREVRQNVASINVRIGDLAQGYSSGFGGQNIYLTLPNPDNKQNIVRLDDLVKEALDRSISNIQPRPVMTAAA